MFFNTPQIAEMLELNELTYSPRFINEDEEKSLLEFIYKEEWITELQRRVQHYGYRYDYSKRNIAPSKIAEPFPEWLEDICDHLVGRGVFELHPNQVIVNEYLPGQGISPHTDSPYFGPVVAGLSLGSNCLMRLYPSPLADDGGAFDLLLERRSLIVFEGNSRYTWRHEIAKRKTDLYHEAAHKRQTRVSLTFRTVRQDILQ